MNTAEQLFVKGQFYKELKCDKRKGEMKSELKCRILIVIGAPLLMVASSSPTFAQTPIAAPTGAVEAASKPAQGTSIDPAKLTLPPPEECLRRVRSFEPTLLKLKETCKSTINAIIPDAAAYEKTLPPIEKVIADKDAKNLRNYGGLSEAFYFNDNAVKGKELFSKFEMNAPEILGAHDTFLGLVKGDIGLYYFFQSDLGTAENYILDAVSKLEPYITAANSNNVLSSYMALAIIYDKSGKNEKALEYATKAVDLSIKQRQAPVK